MDSEIIYSDSLIQINNDSMKFKMYYFPFGSKRVMFSKIEHVKIYRIKNVWRIWGSGDFRTWFPLDDARPSRNTTFIMSFPGKWWRTGFTVEDPEKVIEIFKSKGISLEEVHTKPNTKMSIFWIILIICLGILTPLIIVLSFYFLNIGQG